MDTVTFDDFLLFSMCELLHVAFNLCIYFSLFLGNGDEQKAVYFIVYFLICAVALLTAALVTCFVIQCTRGTPSFGTVDPYYQL